MNKTVTRDLLKDLFDHKITKDQARDLLLETSQLFHDGVINEGAYKYFKFDNYETTADNGVASLETIANWRYKGWPDKCIYCRKPLDYKLFGWMGKNNGLLGLYCHNEEAGKKLYNWAETDKSLKTLVEFLKKISNEE